MTVKTWNIDAAHSSITFAVRHMVFAKVRGRFGDFSGSLHLDPTAPTGGSASVEIRAASIDTGVSDRDAHLRSPDFLDAEGHPTLAFQSTGIEALKGEAYRVHGELTIRGVTRPVTLETTFAGQATDPWGHQRVAFTATTSLDRKAFGLTWNQALEAGGVLVGEKVEVELEVQAVQA